MYYYRRRSSAGSLFLWLIISGIIILMISPRARNKVGGWLSTLSSQLMGFGKNIGKQVNQVGINITDKFRTYKLADLAGGIKRTFTAKPENNATVTNSDHSDVVYYDLSINDDHMDPDYTVSDDTKKYSE